MKTKFTFMALSILLMGVLFWENVVAQQSNKTKTVMVGGAAMYSTKNIVENAVNSKDHTTLVEALKAGGLIETLSSKGPFTVLAPTNEAFNLLPRGTVEKLLKPENKGMLTKVLTYHVLAGKFDVASIWKSVKEMGGKTEMTTVEGGKITFWSKGKDLYVRDAKGKDAKVTISDVVQSNGIIHVIDHVLMP